GRGGGGGGGTGLTCGRRPCPAHPPGRGGGNCGRTAGGGVRDVGVVAAPGARQRGAAVRGQALGRRERGREPGERGGGAGRELLHREEAQEVQHGQAGERAGEAAGGEHVVGAGDVVAERDRAVRPEEHGAGGAHAFERGARLADQQQQVLGRVALGERERIVQRVGKQQRAVRGERGGDDVAARLLGQHARERGGR